jgi:predicted DCC family thiol-disulfide oxidoreductase YuxK
VGAGAQAEGRPRIAGPGASERWLVLYDEDCGLCKSLLAGLLAWDRTARLRPLALQGEEARLALADLSPQERMESWHLIDPAGTRHSGGAALAPLLRLLGGGGPGAALAERFPGAADRGYQWVAEHRTSLSRLVPASVKRRADAAVRRREREAARGGS